MKSLLKWGAILLIVFWIFGKFSGNSSSSASAVTTSNEETPPAGYEKGPTCSACEGTGRYTHDLALVPNTKGAQCASCNGKGFTWQKK